MPAPWLLATIALIDSGVEPAASAMGAVPAKAIPSATAHAIETGFMKISLSLAAGYRSFSAQKLRYASVQAARNCG
jgi:hypothetical protein